MEAQLSVMLVLCFFYPLTCLATTHTTPSYISLAVLIILAALITTLVNFLCFRQTGRAPSLALLRTLWLCLLVNIGWLCYAIYTMYHRYRQHLAYTEFGEAMDKIGYDNFKTKAIPITIMIIIAIILDILFIIRVGNDLRARDVPNRK